MRGIRYINIPTTLLAMVDASSGGKTAIDFLGIKNLVGSFHPPLTTIICTEFLQTLPHTQLLSGYGEMLKHELLSGKEIALPQEITAESLAPLIPSSVAFKQSIVEQDPKESGLRRILNLGHTAGHAFESIALASGREVTHGQAVAQGLVTALVLSHMKAGLSSKILQQVAAHISGHFPVIPFDCSHYPELLRLMAGDKKNSRLTPGFSFVLLEAPGSPLPGIEITKQDLETALDITRDLLHL